VCADTGGCAESVAEVEVCLLGMILAVMIFSFSLTPSSPALQICNSPPQTMKTYLCILISLLLASVASAGSVSLNVKADSENKTADKKKAEVTRAYWLNVRVTNPSGTKLEGVTLKWTLFAANLRRGTDSIVVEKSGEMKITVDANGRAVDIATPKVAFVFTPMHTESSGRRSTKTVEESGHRYHGFHVQVINGDAVLGDIWSNEALRKHELK